MHAKFLSAFIALLTLLSPCMTEATPNIQHWTTAQGTRVYFVRTEGLPMVDLRVVFAAGSVYDGTQHGVASLTSALLDSGAGKWNADDIAQRLESVGAVMETSVSKDTGSLYLRSLTDPDKLNVAVGTLHAILTKPLFTAEDFERQKRQALLSLQEKEESPGNLAEVIYTKAIYGDHPYGHPTDGEIGTVTQLTRNDLVKFYQRYYVAANAMVAIVGDLARADAETLVERLLAGLPQGAPAETLPAVAEPLAATTVKQFFPSTQTHVLIGEPVLIYNDPDYFPLYVGNHILGGSGLVARITQEVREKRGLSYSASSYFSPRAGKGPFTMRLQTRNEQTDKALKVMMETANKFIAEGPTDKELKAAKQNLVGGFVLRIDNNRKIAEYVATIGFYGLPLDYLNTFNAKVQSVTVANIVKAFKTRVDPARFQTVLVGGAAGK
ncbi:pitrilysin family protein [Nitrosomonas sp. Nm34]|uniref:M16 family metallopeptidase n=1 Tax=Nitrosomonas sp. Nm34 TaxID=1881055 RepID=UPI0008EF21BE|nr:pitrilysin family protein [Nitrosomonas sp. Nm34]SFI89784.1 zinc protease [Nitrosomonas sp. Nm34]